MDLGFVFVLNSILLGVGLAMDAFSVSLANGLNEPGMRAGRLFGIAGIFAFFQALMPMIGWGCVHTAACYFCGFERFIPWIALLLLGFIGGKMLAEGIRGRDRKSGAAALGTGALIAQGIATSIDDLSVGFTIANYSLFPAVLCALIIAAVTLAICAAGLMICKRFGTRLAGKASILGGIILIIIGIKIFITGSM